MGKHLQHYVSEGILKNFSIEEKPGKFCVFIVKTNDDGAMVFKKTQDIDNVFCQNKYLTTDKVDYDQVFSNMDNFFPVIISKIIDRGVGLLTDTEKEKLNEFIAIQHQRGIAIRKEAIAFYEEEETVSQKNEYLVIKKFIETSGLDPDTISSLNELDESFGKDGVKHLHAAVVADYQILADKLKKLKLDVISPKNQSVNEEFIISSSPVLHNPEKPEFYFPISPNKYLWFHTANNSLPLNVRYLNELQFLNSARYDGFRLAARSKETLEYLLNNPLTQNEIESLQDPYWQKKMQDSKRRNRL